jgi:acetyl esterase
MASRWLTRFALRRLMRLPPAVLRLLAGGGVVYQGGRTLDAGFQFLAARTRSAPPLATMTPEEARRSLAQAIALSAGDPARGVKTTAFGGGPIPLRAYRPERQDAGVPALVFAHGGGGVLGDLDSVDAFCSQLAAATRGPVVSADYRLAPEDRFPAGLEDFAAAFAFVRDNAARLGAPAGLAAIGGDSLGATFAAAVCQQLKRDRAIQPELQLLLYPLLDATAEHGSMATYADAFGLSRASMDWCLGHYLDPADDPADPRVSPGRASDLSGLAPAIIVAAGFDPLVDQGLSYARRLRDAGVQVDYRVHDSLVHGFAAYAGIIPAAKAACDEATDRTAQALRTQR